MFGGIVASIDKCRKILTLVMTINYYHCIEDDCLLVFVTPHTASTLSSVSPAADGGHCSVLDWTGLQYTGLSGRHFGGLSEGQLYPLPQHPSCVPFLCTVLYSVQCTV